MFNVLAMLSLYDTPLDFGELMQKAAENVWQQGTRFILKVFLVVLAAWLLYLLSSILMPFLISALIAYMCNPLVEDLQRRGMSRTGAASLVFGFLLLIFVSLILLLIPLIQKQISALLTTLPSMVEYAQGKLEWMRETFGVNIRQELAGTVKNATSEDVSRVRGVASGILQTMLTSGRVLFEIMLNIVLIPVVTFYFLRDWNLITQKIYELIPKRYKATTVQLGRECDSVLSGFLRGQLLVMLAMCVMYGLGLSLVGLQVGMVLGVIFGLISIVPYLGTIVGIVVASIAALVQFGSFTAVFWVLLVFLVAQAIQDFYLTPKLIGNRIGLHPVVAIFAMLAGGALFGVFGVLLALPVSAILVVILHHYKHA